MSAIAVRKYTTYRWYWYLPTRIVLTVTLLASVALAIIGIQALGVNPHWSWLDISACVSRPCNLLSLNDFTRFGINLDLTILLDPLAAFFLVLIGGLSIAISLFSFQFLRSEPDHCYIAIIYLCFLASGVLFVVANNVFWALLAIECSTLAFGLLVMHQRNDAIARGEEPDQKHLRAVKAYLIANHIGGAFVAGALLLLAVFASHASGSIVMLDMSKFSGLSISEPAASIIFFLALIGFGIKLGMAPFHVWVAIAHPSSPTNTHAMSLGIMIKIAIFGMIRIFFQFLVPDIQWWWGALLVALAALTALVGVRNAIYGEDLKDSLADHSVENIGIMLVGVGLALLFAAPNDQGGFYSPDLAALALATGLYHVLNHTAFKGLLYICTGAAFQLNEKDSQMFKLDMLGGILHSSRVLGTCFIIGSIALAGFPPFNGFISEWLTLQSVLAGIHAAATSSGHMLSALFSAILLVGVLFFLGTAFALTAFAFVKITGEVFLGTPRKPEQAKYATHRGQFYKITWLQKAVMMGLSAVCLVLGVFAWPVVAWLGQIVIKTVNTVPNLSFEAAQADGYLGISISLDRYSATLSQSLLLALVGIFLVAVVVAVIDRRHRPSHSRATAAPWVTGSKWEPTMQYKSIPFLATWSELAEGSSPVGKRNGSRKFRTPFGQRFELDVPAITPLPGDLEARAAFRWVYAAIIDLLHMLTRKIGAFFHNGQLGRYLTYILLCFVVMLTLWLLWLAS